jgi:hypothetical protein
VDCSVCRFWQAIIVERLLPSTNTQFRETSRIPSFGLDGRREAELSIFSPQSAKILELL